MMLPQLLESALLLAGGESPTAASAGDEGGANELVAAWIDRLALASADLYLSALRGLQGLSPQGAVQVGPGGCSRARCHHLAVPDALLRSAQSAHGLPLSCPLAAVR